MTKVSQRDLAKALNVSPMTVSLALRNSPEVSEATRQRVKKKAAELGYQSDPGLSALNNWRRRKTIREEHTTLAFITNWESEDHWRNSYVRHFFDGASETAAQRGYKLEPFWLGHYDNQDQASRVLHARGIRGLLIAPLYGESGGLDLDWSKFSAVAVGPTLTRPRLHRAIHDYGSGTQDVVEKLRDMGYRKLALGAPYRIDEMTEFRISGAFLSALHRYPELAGSQWIGRVEETAADVQKWLEEVRPEVVITIGDVFPEALRQFRCKIPEEISHVSLRIPYGDENDTAGISYAAKEIGSVAAAKIDSLLQVNELGLPLHPVDLTVRGKWTPGRSLRVPAGNRGGSKHKT